MKKLLNYATKIVAGSSKVVIGVFIAGFILEQVGTKGRFGTTAKKIADSISSGYCLQ